jgi:hypothetical protein
MYPKMNASHLAFDNGWRRARRARLVAGVAALFSFALTITASPASADSVGMEPQAVCDPPSNYSAQIRVYAPQLMPTYAYFAPGMVGGNSQGVRYQATLYGWVNGAWQLLAASPLYRGVANQGSSMMTDWYTPTGVITNGTWTPPRVNAERSTWLYYKVVGEIWWLADAFHAGAHERGTVTHLQWLPGGTSFLQYPMPGYCRY